MGEWVPILRRMRMIVAPNSRQKKQDPLGAGGFKVKTMQAGHKLPRTIVELSQIEYKTIIGYSASVIGKLNK